MSSRQHVRPIGLLLGCLALSTGNAYGTDERLFESTFVGFDAGTFFAAKFGYASCIADFDLDGDADVAVSHWPDPVARIAVLDNAGDGILAPPVYYDIPQGSYRIIAADLDGDSYADLIAANTETNSSGTSISYLHNLQDGTFDTAQSIPTGTGPVGLAAADFDQDGDIDLAVANWGFLGSGKTVTLLTNDGSATFTRTDMVTALGPYALSAADLDGDGLPDLAIAHTENVASTSPELSVYLSDGSGGFSLALEQSQMFSGRSIFPALDTFDAELDGDIDLLYSAPSLAGIAVLENTGTATFAPPQKMDSPPFTSGPTALAAADVTADGWPDILGTQTGSGGWSLWASEGPGTWSPVQRMPTAEAPLDVHVADMDGDGDLDPVILNRDSLEVAIHTNPGNGDFSPPPSYPVDVQSFFFDHGDIDGDGDLDVVNAGPTLINILKNQGDGTFAAKVNYVPPSSALDIKLRDLDNDGDLDLLWNEGGPPYRWGSALNEGNGSFGPGTMWPVPTCGYFRSEIDAYDLDNDGDLDVVQIESLGCPGILFQRIFIHENLGGAQFTLANTIVANPGPRSVAAGDFNGDGSLDLALTGQPTMILLGNGDLSFVSSSAAMVPGINISTADFNADGRVDLAIALQRNVAPFVESMVIQLGVGDGTFGSPVTYLGSHSPTLAQISEIQVGDVDSDGDVDVLCMNDASNDVSVWLNNGDGTFQPHVRYSAGMSSLDLSYADFTGDGIADLATVADSFPPFSSGLQINAGKNPSAVLCQQDLGFGGPGLASLSLCGTSRSAQLLLDQAATNSPAWLLIGPNNPTPLFGGTIVPFPFTFLLPVATDSNGQFSIPTIPLSGGPFTVYLQAAYLDPVQPAGVGISNALAVQFVP